MSNNNKDKNEISIEEINPQISIIMMNTSDNNNLINKDENKGIFYNIFKPKIFAKNKYKINNNLFTLSKILQNKNNKFENELFDNFKIYKTEAFYKEGKCSKNINEYKPCRLLIKENNFYVLRNNNRTKISDMYINPENSFLDKLDNHNIVEKNDIKYIKYDYELSNPYLCLDFNLMTCTLLINKKNLNEFTILILGTKKQYSFIIQDSKQRDKFCYILGTFIYNSEGYANNK